MHCIIVTCKNEIVCTFLLSYSCFGFLVILLLSIPQNLYLHLKFLKFSEKIRFSQVVVTGQNSVYKSSQLSAVK